jgi:hypothetical protein
MGGPPARPHIILRGVRGWGDFFGLWEEWVGGVPQGLKPESIFSLCGTSEVVPFPDCVGFSAASEVVLFPVGKSCGGGPQKPET